MFIGINPPGAEGGFDYALAWQDFDCEKRLFRMTKAGGRIIGGSNGELTEIASPEWKIIPAGSISDVNLKSICSKKPEIGLQCETPDEAAQEARKVAKKIGLWD